MSDSLLTNVDFPPSTVLIPVSMLNRLARERLEQSFPLCWVTGEVSNLVHATSGHVYFSLKDSQAQARCIMYRQRAQLLGWRLENGQHIDVRARVTLYEARGDFQLNVDVARKTGSGNLYEQFLRLKEKLEKEGLFSQDGKRALPEFPRRVGIITSAQAAALRDVLSTLKRRAPHLEVIIYPTQVQGEGAAQQIGKALKNAGTRGECDVLILCRGGGSLEDLWAFNDETLARAIRASAIPVISGVGHETDFTIADFVADCRAPTPTAAAELAAPEKSALLRRLDDCRLGLKRPVRRSLDQKSQRLDGLAQRLIRPEEKLARQKEHLLNLRRRLVSALGFGSARNRSALADLKSRFFLSRPGTDRLAQRVNTLAFQLHGTCRKALDARSFQLARMESSLVHLNPEGVLARGYSIVFNEKDEIVRDSLQLEPNETISVSFHKGNALAVVSSLVTSLAQEPPHKR